MTSKRDWAVFKEQVRTVLLAQWNPVGVSIVPTDEYDAYLNAVCYFTDTGLWDLLLDYLCWVEKHMFGQEPTMSMDRIKCTIGILQLVKLKHDEGRDE